MRPRRLLALVLSRYRRGTCGCLIRLPVLLIGVTAATAAAPTAAASSADSPLRVAATISGAGGTHGPSLRPLHAWRGAHARLGLLVKRGSAVQAQQAGVDGTHKGLAVFCKASLLLASANNGCLDLVVPRRQGHMIGVEIFPHLVMCLAVEQLENSFPVASLGELPEPKKALEAFPSVPQSASSDAKSVELSDQRCPEAVEVFRADLIRKNGSHVGRFEIGRGQVSEIS